MTLKKGDRIKVIKGRKAKDVVGTIFWFGDNKFGEGKRLGIEGDDGETYWVPEDYVEPTKDEAPEVEPPEKGARVRFEFQGVMVEAEVFWSGPSKSGRGHRVGVKDGEGEPHWLDARKVEIVVEDGAEWNEEEPAF